METVNINIVILGINSFLFGLTFLLYVVIYCDFDFNKLFLFFKGYRNEKKYKFTRDKQKIQVGNKYVKLRRIQAVRDFGEIKAGEFGGFIEKKTNLSHEGEAWVGEEAKVYEKARICGCAQIRGSARVYGNVIVEDVVVISEKAEVCGEARITEGAEIRGNAKVYGNAVVSGYSEISGNAQVHGFASIDGEVWISGNAKIYGKAHVKGKARIYESAIVYGEVWISGNAKIHGRAKVNRPIEMDELDEHGRIIGERVE